MAEFPALPLWTDAYLADTTHLSTIEHGAYLLLLMAMWRSKECKLPNNDKLLAKYAGLTAGQWQRIKPSIWSFFVVTSDSITQGRLTDEAIVVRQNSKRQSNNSRSRWLKNNDNGDATGLPNECQIDAPTTTPTTTPMVGVVDSARDGINPDEVGRNVLEIMGVANDPTWFGNSGRVHQWIADGCDPELDIYPTVRRLMAKKGNDIPKTLRYFDAAVSRARMDRTEPLPEPKPRQQRTQPTQPQPHPKSAKAALDRFRAEMEGREFGK